MWALIPYLLSIDLRLSCRVVARSRDRAWVDQFVQPLAGRGVQLDVHGTCILPEMVEPRRARDRNDVLALRQQPRQYQLRHRAVALTGNRGQGRKELEVAGEVFSLKSWHRQADVLCRQG